MNFIENDVVAEEYLYRFLSTEDILERWQPISQAEREAEQQWRQRLAGTEAASLLQHTVELKAVLA